MAIKTKDFVPNGAKDYGGASWSGDAINNYTANSAGTILRVTVDSDATAIDKIVMTFNVGEKPDYRYENYLHMCAYVFNEEPKIIDRTFVPEPIRTVSRQSTTYPSKGTKITLTFSALSIQGNRFYIFIESDVKRDGSILMDSPTVSLNNINFNVTYTAPDQPTVTVTALSPDRVEYKASDKVSFSWKIENDTQVSAEVQISEDNQTWTPIKTVTTKTSADVGSGNILPGNYYWKVKVKTKNSGWPESDVLLFKIVVNLTGKSPNMASYYPDDKIEFSWTVEGGSQETAFLEYSTDNEHWSRISGNPGQNNKLDKYGRDFGPGLYYWRVTVSLDEYSNYTKTSDPLLFTVLRSQSTPVDPTPIDPTPEPIIPDPVIVYDVPPSINEVTVSVVQPSEFHSDFDGVYVAGYSKCRVRVEATVGTYALTSTSAVFTYTGYSQAVRMTKVSGGEYEGTTPTALSGNTTITVTVIDEGGGMASKTVSVSVIPYAPPTIRVTNYIRCDSQGDAEEGGKYFRVEAIANCSDVDNLNRITSFQAGVLGGTMHDFSNGSVLSGEELSDENAVYVISVTATDLAGGQANIQLSLAGKLRDVVFKRDMQNYTAHVGVGMAPTGGAVTTIELPPNGDIKIGGQSLIAWLQTQIENNFPGWNPQ